MLGDQDLSVLNVHDIMAIVGGELFELPSDFKTTGEPAGPDAPRMNTSGETQVPTELGRTMTTRVLHRRRRPCRDDAWVSARTAGVQTVVVEKHADFLRDFRGDTVHPSTLQIMRELGLLDEFLKRPHQELDRAAGAVRRHHRADGGFPRAGLSFHCFDAAVGFPRLPVRAIGAISEPDGVAQDRSNGLCCATVIRLSALSRTPNRGRLPSRRISPSVATGGTRRSGRVPISRLRTSARRSTCSGLGSARPLAPATTF